MVKSSSNSLNLLWTWTWDKNFLLIYFTSHPTLPQLKYNGSQEQKVEWVELISPSFYVHYYPSILIFMYHSAPRCPYISGTQLELQNLILLSINWKAAKSCIEGMYNNIITTPSFSPTFKALASSFAASIFYQNKKLNSK